MKKRDTDHQSVSLENKTGDSTVLKIGNSAKVVIKQDMKGRRHKYGFNSNKRENAEKIMGSPPASTPPPPTSPPPHPPPSEASASPSAVKRTRKASRLRSLSTRPPSAERPVVHVDPATGKADGPHRKKLRTYLGIVARDKVDVTYENWKKVPTTQKDLIWEEIHAEFDIPEASDSRTKRKLLQTVGRDGGSLNQTLRGNGPLQPIRTVSRTLSMRNTTSARKSGPSFARLTETLLGRYVPYVRKKAQTIQKQNTAPHILSRGGYDYLEQKLLAEKMKKKLEEGAQSRSVDGVINPPSPMRRHDVLAAAIGAGVTIKQYFGSAPRMSRNASSLTPDELQQLTQQIRDQLEESITEKVTRQVMASFSHMQSQLQLQMQSQGIVVPPDPLVGPSGPQVSTKGSCVDPSRNDPETGDSDRCGLYIEADPARLVPMGRVYEGSTVVHNTPLLPGQVKVSVEEVTDADTPVPVPTDEVSLVGQALHTFFAWPTHLVKSLSQQVAVSPTKPPPNPDPEVDDPLYLMTLTIPKLFLRPYQVRWDATVFESIQRSGQSQFESESYIKSWMQSSQRDVYLGAYLNGGHWQMVVILPKEHLVVWFCSLHNRPDNYLKGIINSAIKGLDDAPQPKSKASARWIVVKCNRQKGSTECGYYVMHWMSTIILGTFRNNWEAYFNDPRPLEPERLKALRIQWAQFYLRVRDQA
ncbi:hypothetical protein GmHk_06G017471 [Glycine max]|nr:hypothetical protein GmHk_06G017471 [Glycine max]